MSERSLQPLSDQKFDVVICGGGLAGLTLARQLRRAHPTLDILVAERTTRPLPEAAHKVGESSVELGSRYLENLGLRDYLTENHLLKFGLRFFLGSGKLPLLERTEAAPAREPVVRSYQLDRGRLENDLREMIEADGVTLLEGVKVGGVELNPGDELHSLEIQRLKASDGSGAAHERARIHCRWLVDATGRASLLRKRMKLTRGLKHVGNASWFRLEGKIDITDFVPTEHRPWHEAEWADDRWRSTNHFMGPGYWVWVIPLSSGNTSIGVVTHDSHHDFDQIRSLERTRAFLEEHEPVLAAELAPYPVLDFGCLRGYSHNTARSWSADRWAIVGEAGAFVDPFYAPGTDFIAYANCFTEELIRRDLAGEELVGRARELSVLYRSLVAGAADLYRDAAEVYGHGDALLAKVYWDNFAYWSNPCQLFMQELYRLTGDDLLEVGALGQRFSDLTRNMQKLFGAWAQLTPPTVAPGFRELFGFPSLLIDAHLALQNDWNPREATDYIGMRLAQAEEMAGEIVIRALDAVGPDNVDALVERAEIFSWGIRISDQRVSAHDTIGLARHQALPPLAKNVERSMGEPPKNIDEPTIRRVLAPIIGAPDGADPMLAEAAEGASANVEFRL